MAFCDSHLRMIVPYNLASVNTMASKHIIIACRVNVIRCTLAPAMYKCIPITIARIRLLLKKGKLQKRNLTKIKTFFTPRELRLKPVTTHFTLTVFNVSALLKNARQTSVHSLANEPHISIVFGIIVITHSNIKPKWVRNIPIKNTLFTYFQA